MNARQALRQARRALAHDDWDAARALLADQVQPNPDDQDAWLWLSALLDDPRSQAACLEKVLDLNPGHRAAQRFWLAVQASTLPCPTFPLSTGALRWSMLGVCGLCARPAVDLRLYLVYTVRVETKSGYVEDDYRGHFYGVCGTCAARRDRLVPLLCLLPLLVLLAFWCAFVADDVLAAVRGLPADLSGSAFDLGLLCCAIPFLPVILAGAIMRALSVEQNLARRAARQRRRAAGGGRYKGFVRRDFGDSE